MGVYVVGVVGIMVFYVAVLALGFWAGTKQKNSGEEEVMLAGRNLGLTVGVFTLVATWVGGGYINGTAEVMFTTGLVWCQVPIGYSVSLLFGVLLFVKKMRQARYFTILDPFQQKYGNRVGGLLFLPALCGDLFWIGAVFSALGSALVVILELDSTTSVVVSAAFAAAYTMAGGLYSVSYTDVLQLFCIVFGLVLSAPFAYHHEAVDREAVQRVDWLGTLEAKDAGEWIDVMLLIVFGGIPWQGYFQRILSMRSVRQAQVLSVLALVGCATMALPPALFGIVAKSTDWTRVKGFNRTITDDDKEIILPLSLRYLTPGWVSFFGLGALSAAVMSSADSGILSSSSMFSRNIYKLAIRPKASEREVLWVLRLSVVVVTLIATSIALTVNSIYYLSYLCSDLVYVILFPQLLLVIHWESANTYGCLASFFVGLVLRLLGGEPGLGVPAAIRYPWFDEATDKQKFPFRTFTMLCAVAAHLLGSWGSRQLFQRGLLPARWDALDVFAPRSLEPPAPSLADANVKRAAPVDNVPFVISAADAPSPVDGVSNPLATDERSDSKF